MAFEGLLCLSEKPKIPRVQTYREWKIPRDRTHFREFASGGRVLVGRPDFISMEISLWKTHTLGLTLGFSVFMANNLEIQPHVIWNFPRAIDFRREFSILRWNFPGEYRFVGKFPFKKGILPEPKNELHGNFHTP